MSSILANAVAAALGAVKTALPELARTMRADESVGSVVLASSVDKGLDAASSSGATETRRYVARVEDFPALERESLVEIDGDAHIITSLKKTGEAAWFVGLSSAMEESSVILTGARRERSVVRTVEATLPALVCEGDGSISLDAIYASNAQSFFYVVIRLADWAETSRPETGDSLEFYFHEPIEARVAKVDRRSGYYLITARSR